MLYRAVWYIS